MFQQNLWGFRGIPKSFRDPRSNQEDIGSPRIVQECSRRIEEVSVTFQCVLADLRSVPWIFKRFQGIPGSFMGVPGVF